MANQQFDLPELKRNTGNADAQAHFPSSLVELVDDRRRTGEVPDKNGTPSDAQAGDDLEFKLKPGEKASASEQISAQALDAFSKIKDKQAALTQTQPQFKAGISRADADFQQTTESAEAAMVKLAPKLKVAEANVVYLDEKMSDAIQALPEKDQEKVDKLVQAYLELDAKDPLRTAMENGMTSYKGIVPLMQSAYDAVHAPEIAEANRLQGTVADAAGSMVTTRLMYAQALKAAGHVSEAREMTDQAAAILGIPVPEEREHREPLQKA